MLAKNHLGAPVFRMYMRKCVMLIVGVAGLFLAGCVAPRATKWEYKEVSRIPDVNKAADEGWEVAGYAAYVDTITHHYQRFLLKRPKQ